GRGWRLRAVRWHRLLADGHGPERQGLCGPRMRSVFRPPRPRHGHGGRGVSRYTDTELLDALEHYAWRVEGVCLPDGYRYTVRADVFGGPVLGEGRTWREALSAALNRASESETRAERCRPGQDGG